VELVGLTVVVVPAGLVEAWEAAGLQGAAPSVEGGTAVLLGHSNRSLMSWSRASGHKIKRSSSSQTVQRTQAPSSSRCSRARPLRK